MHWLLLGPACIVTPSNPRETGARPGDLDVDTDADAVTDTDTDVLTDTDVPTPWEANVLGLDFQAGVVGGELVNGVQVQSWIADAQLSVTLMSASGDGRFCDVRYSLEGAQPTSAGQDFFGALASFDASSRPIDETVGDCDSLAAAFGMPVYDLDGFLQSYDLAVGLMPLSALTPQTRAEFSKAWSGDWQIDEPYLGAVRYNLHPYGAFDMGLFEAYALDPGTLELSEDAKGQVERLRLDDLETLPDGFYQSTPIYVLTP